jgi:hypothetical protein
MPRKSLPKYGRAMADTKAFRPVIRLRPLPAAISGATEGSSADILRLKT